MTLRTGLPGLCALALACGNDAGPSPVAVPSSPAAGCSATPVAGAPVLTTARVASGLSSPLDLQSPPGDRRLFVVEQPGRIRIVKDGALLPAPFLDITARVGSGGERGLLGLAFHPRYADNGRFFVNYTDRSGDTHVAEFRASPPGADLADPATERLVLFVAQPFANHNGGGLAFGPDGRLYAGLGDGGSGGDPLGNGQSLATPLGKLLRFDVDGAAPFAIPPDNPFAATPGAFGLIWAYGLRNPWRFSFDRASGDLYIGDVGQNQVEEIDYAAAPRRGGENYGWNVMEGSQCFRPASGCVRAGLTLPIAEYTHADGCSVTGGVVYRGCRLPGYQGTYFYGDYCRSFVRSFRVVDGIATDARDWTAMLGRGLGHLTSFGTDSEGEVYLVDGEGAVFKVVPAS